MILTLKARAKVNLFLDVSGRRNDGYHEIVSVMHKVSLHDIVTLYPDSSLGINCRHPEVPRDGSNLCLRAARSLIDYTGFQKCGARIHIDKNIPVAAGLGGGSADAAATLIGLNQAWGLGLDESVLSQIGAGVGSDVPFCLNGVSALATGRGEVLTRLESVCQFWLILLKPWGTLSSRRVYEKWDELNNSGEHPNNDALRLKPNPDGVMAALGDGDTSLLARSLYNALEKPAVALLPEILLAKKVLLDNGCKGAIMSGSGPTVIGVARDACHAEEIRASIVRSRHEWQNVIITSTVTATDLMERIDAR